MKCIIWNLASVQFEIVLVSIQDLVCAQCTTDSEIIGKFLMVLLGEEAQVKARFGLFRDFLILMKDWCTVCMEHTIFSKINLDAPDRTPRSCVSYGISLQSVWRQC